MVWLVLEEIALVEARSRLASLRLVGGSKALDFVNTITGRLTTHPTDFLPDFDSMIAWSLHARIVNAAERDACVLAGANDRSAQAVHRRALVLREALYGIFSARAEGQLIASGDLKRLDEERGRAARTWRLASDGRLVCWQWPMADPALALARIAADAAALLTNQPTPRLRRCSGAEHGCAWLFLDTSRGGTRRWCSMPGCGNRAKVRAHYRRRHPA
jgi:predicted RNA-binding Zn ribbon-like protein